MEGMDYLLRSPFGGVEGTAIRLGSEWMGEEGVEIAYIKNCIRDLVMESGAK